MDPLAAPDFLHDHVAREDLDVERDVGRHLDLELGVDDVVVAIAPVVVFLVGLDRDAGAGLDDLELDVIEPLARRAPDGVHGDVGPVAAGDGDPAGEVLQAELPAGPDGYGAVDPLGLVLLGGNRRGRERHRAQDHECRNMAEFHHVFTSPPS